VIDLLAPARLPLFSALLFVFASATDAAPSNRLLTDAHAAQRPDWMTPQLQRETRGRMARLDARVLERMSLPPALTNGNAPVVLDLFEDAAFALTVQHVESFGRAVGS
jgi:hypothetical protein